MSTDRLRAHWGLSRTPFTKELATSMLFASAAHQEAVARVGWIITERALGVVCGEVGAGKTVAARAATAMLDSSRYSIIYLPNPAIGARGIYTQIVTALGATPRFYRATLIPQATDLIAAETAERGKTVVLILDEAHLLGAEQLEELRILTNAEMDSRATFACLLLGQPTLRRKLRQGTFAALDQRIALRCTIDGMEQRDRRIHRPPRQARGPRRHDLLRRRRHADPRRVPRAAPPGEQPRDTDTDRSLRDQQVDLRRELRPRRAHRDHRRMTGELISLFNQPEPAPAGPRALALPPPPACWPAPPDPAAYHGLPGQVVAKIAPHTEADPAAILVQLLICCGALIGRDAHYRVEATHHHPNEFVVLVGDSAKARKGSSFDHVARLLGHADPAFTARLTTGLSSGDYLPRPIICSCG
jgi:type II secretory pathway predicted ATPase ExeA